MVLIEPNLKVEDIEIQMDKNSESLVKRLTSEWGRNVPIIKIGDLIIPISDILNFRLTVGLNSVPTFSLTINDENYRIREVLKKSIDTCVIFIGWKNWYYKFNGLLTNTYSGTGDKNITIPGILYNPKLYEGQQYSFKNMTIENILKEVCGKSGMGLFTYNNTDLNQILDYSLMTGTRYIDYFDWLISNYTNNIYAIDCHGYIHVGSIDSIRKQQIDKYNLSWQKGEPFEKPQDIVFRSIVRQQLENSDGIVSKIPIELYTINTNFSGTHYTTYNSYSIGYGGNGESVIPSLSTLGIGSNKDNTFFGFKNHKKPFLDDIIDKDISGNEISFETENIIFELNPLGVVGLEIYLPYHDGEPMKLDEEHSGKKIVTGFDIEYRKNSKEFGKLIQTIRVI